MAWGTEMDKFLAEVEDRALLIAGISEFSLYSGELQRLPVRVPQMRKGERQGFSFYSLSRVEILRIWNWIWEKTSSFDVMSMALYHYQRNTPDWDEVSVITGWVSRCTCWEHSDDLSKIFADATEVYPERMVPLLQKWNEASGSWYRRQSLVSLMEYAPKRRRFLPFELMAGQVLNLLKDEEYYVQKGVGWTLRELYRAYPQKTMELLKKHITDISPVAYTASVEALPKEIRDSFRQERKANRTQFPSSRRN